MRVRVDTERCEGHGRCYDIAPEVFEPDDEGHVVLLIGGELPLGCEVAARSAVSNCPEQALALDR